VFRWHDSGDLQGVWHLDLIVAVADRLPWVRFWIPTREFAVLRVWMREHGAFPANLTVRQSAALVGHLPNPAQASGGRVFSGVAHPGQEIPEDVHVCPSRSQGNECGDCRACWSADVPVVIYPLH